MANSADISLAAPTHHPSAELLIDYAAGAMSQSESLLIAIHLEVCARCRRTAKLILAVGGSLLDAIAPAQLAPSSFQRTLQALDAAEPPAQAAPRPMAAFPAKWPAVLRDRLAAAPRARWRRLPAGFNALRLPFDDRSSRVWIMNAPAGRGPFRHAHIADEWTVVLEGGFSDETGTYAVGDFAYMGPGEEHTMVAEHAEGCVCVILVREQPRYLTWPGRLLAPLLKL